MTVMRLLLCATLLTLGAGACAEAGKLTLGGRPDGGSITIVDSDMHQPPPPDAFVPPIDAPPGMTTKTLDENTSDTNVSNTAPACGTSAATDVNNYYRVFDLPTFGINTDFHITHVDFQVDYCSGQTVTVNVGVYNGTPGATISTGNMMQVASNTTVTVPSTTTGASVPVPFTNATIPAGKKLYVEIKSPAGGKFYMGANTAGESGAGYIGAAQCNLTIATPKDISSVDTTDFPIVNILITATGTY